MAEITKTVENVDIDFAEIVVNGTSYESSNYVPSQSESSSSNNNSSTTTPAVTPSQEVENTTGQKVNAVLLNTVQHDIEDKSLTERVEILEEGLETESETRLQQDLSLDSKIDTSVSTLNTRIDNITPQSIGAIPTTEKAEPLGVATLDANGRLEASQLPNNSRRLVGTIDASSQHDLPSTSLYTSGDEFLVIKEGYINQSTAFTLTAGNVLTDLEVTQANYLIIEGYVFTLYEGETTLGTVIGFATDKVNLEGGTVINLPYASDLSATSVPDSVQISVKTGDTFINIDNHWIHLTNTSSVDSVNGMTGAVVLPVDDEISETSENPVQNKVLAQALKTAGKVKTVNEQTPDENGNITTDKELTLAQYEALSEEEKNNGTNYFVNDFNGSNDLSALMLRIYPIGAVYISTVNADPSGLFGGEWEQIKDTFLLSAGDTYEGGSSGGEATHTHTLSSKGYAKIVIHSTGRLCYNEIQVPTWTANYSLNANSGTSSSESEAWGVSLGGKTDNSSTLPPYLTVYMWKRTA